MNHFVDSNLERDQHVAPTLSQPAYDDKELNDCDLEPKVAESRQVVSAMAQVK